MLGDFVGRPKDPLALIKLDSRSENTSAGPEDPNMKGTA